MPVRSRAAFLHISKCAGTSVVSALQQHLGPQAQPRHTFDRCYLAGFDTPALLSAQAASRVLWDDVPVLDSPHAVGHHWSLPTLLRAFAPRDVATVLREPAVRILSYAEFARSLPPRNRRGWWPDTTATRVTRASLLDLLCDPSLSRATDNLMTRQTLWGDPRIPVNGFISDDDTADLAADAIARLTLLGFVGVVENPAHLARGMSAWLGAEVSVPHDNPTSPRQLPGFLDSPDQADEARDHLMARSRVDRIVWEHFAEGSGIAAPGALARRLIERRLASVFATAFYAQMEPVQPQPNVSVPPQGALQRDVWRELAQRGPDHLLIVDSAGLAFATSAGYPPRQVTVVADDPGAFADQRQIATRHVLTVNRDLVDVSAALAGHDVDAVVVGPEVQLRRDPRALLRQLAWLLDGRGVALLALVDSVEGRLHAAGEVAAAATDEGWLLVGMARPAPGWQLVTVEPPPAPPAG